MRACLSSPSGNLHRPVPDNCDHVSPTRRESKMFQKLLRQYQEASQAVYESWCNGTADEVLPHIFEAQYLPEPYLDFGFSQDENFCVFLTTNPGKGSDVQLREGVEKLCGGSVPIEYHPLARTMACHYDGGNSINNAARANIEAMKGIASAMGRTGLLQVEMVPWHSPNLPDKDGAVAELSESALFMNYRTALERLIRACPLVLSWSAGFPARRTGTGVDFKANAMGFDLASANILELSRTDRGISQALLWTRDSTTIRGLFVRQGSANLPANRLLSSKIPTYDMIAKTLGA